MGLKAHDARRQHCDILKSDFDSAEGRLQILTAQPSEPSRPRACVGLGAQADWPSRGTSLGSGGGLAFWKNHILELEGEVQRAARGRRDGESVLPCEFGLCFHGTHFPPSG